MTGQTEFAVLRFVDKNGYCHVIHDYVKGVSLAQHIKEHPQTEKEVLFQWLDKITAGIIQYYKWKEADCYGYLNPYGIITTEEGELVFLDAKDEENEEILSLMQRKNIRTMFLPPERILSLKMTFGDDMYSLGKTIQFLAAQCAITPRLTGREKRILKRTVQHCLDRQIKNIKDLKEVYRNLRRLMDRRGEKKCTGGRKKIVAAGLCIAVCLSGTALWKGRRQAKAAQKETTAEKQKPEPSQMPVTPDKGEEELIRSKLEMGLLYITELGDEKKGIRCLEEIQDKSELAPLYLKIVDSLKTGSSETYVEREVEQNLRKLSEKCVQLQGQTWWEEKQVLYQMPILRAYRLVGGRSAAEQVIRLCTGFLEHEVWKGRADETEREVETRMYLAGAYEGTEETERAIKEYEIVKGLEKEESGLEQVYVKLEELYEKGKEADKAWEVLREGTEKIPQSGQLWILYLRRCCGDSSIDREVCAEYVKNALDAVEGLQEQEEFKKLQREYKITIEGENICVGE